MKNKTPQSCEFARIDGKSPRQVGLGQELLQTCFHDSAHRGVQDPRSSRVTGQAGNQHVGFQCTSRVGVYHPFIITVGKKPVAAAVRSGNPTRDARRDGWTDVYACLCSLF